MPIDDDKANAGRPVHLSEKGPHDYLKHRSGKMSRIKNTWACVPQGVDAMADWLTQANI